jgi:signal transduction histidine kinase
VFEKEQVQNVVNLPLKSLLPSDVLEHLISSFEAVFGIDNLFVVYDLEDRVYYARNVDYAPCEAQAVIYAAQEEIAKICLCHPAEPILVKALEHFASSLSYIATEIYRRRQLADEVLERYDELNLIYDLGMILTQGLTQEQLVATVLKHTNQIIQAEAGVIYVTAIDSSELVPISYFGDKSDREFWMGRMHELALSTLHAYESTQLFDAGRVICSPLRYGNERIGALILMYQHENKVFRANDVNLLTTLTHNTALFIQASRLYNQLAQRHMQLEVALHQLRAARDELSQAERLSIVGQTVSSLVHDMKNPLGIVMGYAGLLEEPDITYQERKEFAGQIIQYITQFSDMAQEILDFAQKDEQIQKKPVQVGPYMEQIRGLLSPPGLQPSVQIVVDATQVSHYQFNIDPQRFARIFQNLVNNAVDAIETKGGSKVEVIGETVGNDLRFTITDDGPGVPEEIVDRIFDPFVTHGKQHGTGLGLAIVKRMVNIHGGDIQYQPAPGGGAQFVFTVPRMR